MKKSTTQKKLRRLGDITEDLEPLLFELAVDHDLQRGEILALIFNWINVHVPEAIEEYTDGSEVEYYYGPKRNLEYHVNEVNISKLIENFCKREAVRDIK